MEYYNSSLLKSQAALLYDKLVDNYEVRGKTRSIFERFMLEDDFNDERSAMEYINAYFPNIFEFVRVCIDNGYKGQFEAHYMVNWFYIQHALIHIVTRHFITSEDDINHILNYLSAISDDL